MAPTGLDNLKTRWHKRALLKGIVESFEGLIYVSSQDYHIEYVNQRMIKQKGIDPSSGPCFKVLHARESPCPFCVKDQVNFGKTVSFEVKDPRDQRWYRSVNTPLHHDDGGISHLSLISDIHDRKMAEIDLQENAEKLRSENILLKSHIEERQKFGNIVGKSKPMQSIYEQILTAASSDATVVIYGEPGTGKELVAHAIHNMSERRNHRFVPVHCGAIPENLIESEFFGYKKGAFSGADSSKQGYIDFADGGTVFLDEIGEISLNMQVKLLRVIEAGGYTPVGGTETKQSDFRIISATNRNLMARIGKGAFREDFFYRIHILPIHLPPLRQRKEDIPLLIEHFILMHRGKQPTLPMTDAMLDKLMGHDWPGNVRELQNVVIRYCMLHRIDLNTSEVLPPTMPAPAISADPHDSGESLNRQVERLEKHVILSRLTKNRWNRSQTAKQLGIDRKTLFHKMKRFGLE